MQNVQTLKISRTREILFSAAFTAFAVYSPILVHHFGGVGAGRKFLPMPLFVLLAGLLLGWRAGLATALASSSISFLLTGMPKAEILPFIVVQLCAFGFFAGILKEKYNVFVSLSGAIILGFLAMGMAALFFSKMNAVVFVASAVRDGWFGILAQITLIPLLAKVLALKPRQD